jgi:hypothetical protein
VYRRYMHVYTCIYRHVYTHTHMYIDKTFWCTLLPDKNQGRPDVQMQRIRCWLQVVGTQVTTNACVCVCMCVRECVCHIRCTDAKKTLLAACETQVRTVCVCVCVCVYADMCVYMVCVCVCVSDLIHGHNVHMYACTYLCMYEV